MAQIKRRRGNTRKDLFTVTRVSTGAAVDIAGCSFVMHVTTDKAPDAVTPGENLLYSLTGTIVDPLAGTVTFAPTLEQATQADGTYYFEVVMTDTDGLTETVALDKYVFY